MATPSKIVAALASGTQETNLALAHVNFDFSLIKLDAPASFQEVGTLLSKKRKVAAESGLTHVTARKLGALFENLLPSTPRLVEQYGTRASEIARMTETHHDSTPFYDMFADHAGIDATSIWAAATSGMAAIAVHLLACMLARMFPGPVATSIWAELTEERKRELSDTNSPRHYNISTILAAQVSIPREQLAEWDNSARSWLRVADEAMTVRQNQLLLIIKNLHIPISNDKTKLYTNVISAWTRALTLMESLLGGAAQCITPFEGNGDLLLALASWHIYPDMNAPGNIHIAQRDPLVPSEAILSVGVECSPAQQDIGVYWSLPLSRFKYYGPPKQATHALCTDAERVTFTQFRFVLLGCFLSSWGGKSREDIDKYVDLIIRIYDYITAGPPIILHVLESETNWLRELTDTCHSLRNSKDSEKAVYNRLVGLGLRRGTDFMSNQPCLFGLITSFSNFFALLEGMEMKINALRKYASRTRWSMSQLIIRYINPNARFDRLSKNTLNDEEESWVAEAHHDPHDDQDISEVFDGEESRDESETPELNQYNINGETADQDDETGFYRYINTLADSGKHHRLPSNYFVYASVIGRESSSGKRSWDGREIHHMKHRRWTVVRQRHSLSETLPEEEIMRLQDLGLLESSSDKICMYEGRVEFKRIMGDPNEFALFATDSRSCPLWADPNLDFQDHEILLFPGIEPVITCNLDMSEETIYEAEFTPLQMFLNGSNSGPESFNFNIQLEDVLWALENEAFDRSKLAAFISASNVAVCTEKPEEFIEMKKLYIERRAWSVVAKIYAQFPKATVPLKVIETSFLEQKWLTKWGSFCGFRDLCFRGHEDDCIHCTEAYWTKKLNYPQVLAIPHSGATWDRFFNGVLPFDISRAECFSLLAVMETGTVNLGPDYLEEVMAISSGDSLFVASPLLVDPSTGLQLENSSIRWIRGNIGKPGVGLIVSPPELQMKPRDSANWTLINHNPFDGNFSDCFEGTSLHLTLTDYSRPVTLGHHGLIDAEAYFVEGYIQINYKGKWIGDIDVIAGRESNKLTFFGDGIMIDPKATSCRHSAKNLRALRLISVDNWDEFVDPPAEGIIVRAKDNWMARLAATYLSVQRRNRTIVLSTQEPICWPCVRDQYNLGASLEGTTFIC